MSQQLPTRDHIKRPGPGPNPASVNSTPVPPRPDSRGGYQAQQSNRISHNLPTRPDTQPLRPRLNDRPGERLAEYGQTHGRHDTRVNGPSEYGRLERPGAQQGRPTSPGRQPRPRSQDRTAAPSDRPDWSTREPRDYDDRSLRGPTREVRGPTDRNAQYGDNHRDHRENRDQRDYRMREPHRERNDSRGPPPLPSTPGDTRSRPHAGSGPMPNDTLPHRRDTPGHHNDRSGMAARPPINAGPAPSINPQRVALIEQEVSMDRGPPARVPYQKDDRVNPDRAALILDDRNRNTPARPDREGRDARSSYEKEGDRQGRDRGSFVEAGERHGRDSRTTTFIKDDQNRTPGGRSDRDARSDDRDMRRGPPTDRHDERTLPPYFNNDNRNDNRNDIRNDNRRDYRDDRSQPQPYPNSRDRREEFSSNAPTGPRSGRDGPGGSLHVSREMFQPSQSSRPVISRQDPSYGRLNQPSESIPSGPRSKKCRYRFHYPRLTQYLDPISDSRDVRSHAPAQAQSSGPMPPQPSGVHPSRMSNFDGPGSRAPSGPPPPPLQTDVVNAPSGPRGSGRTPLPSPSTIRGGPPTGPAGAERHIRRQDSRNQLGAINTVLSQSGGQGQAQTPTLPPSVPPPERSGERSQGERGHRRDERRSREDERKGDERSREKRDGSRRDRESRGGGEREGGRESSHRERGERSDRDRRDDRRSKDDRERERGEKRSRDPKDQPHGDSKRSRR